MSLVGLSFAHQNAPISFREQVFFDDDALANACARFRCGPAQQHTILEFLILSTCNRTEVYAYVDHETALEKREAIQHQLLEFISQARSISVNQLRQYASWRFGPDVAGHLSRVACGLESLVVGEPQILGQVGDAMRTGLIMNSCGAVLAKLFQAAIRAGRRARTETQIGHHSLNISTVAVNTAEKLFSRFDGKTVVVLGAGEMADLALQQLRRKGASDIKVVNRTINTAKELAAKHDASAHVFEQITELIPAADLLITSTGAPHTLISKQMIQFSMRTRRQRPMFILDIAVPRDVDPTVEQIENVHRCDIDDLHMVTGDSVKLREQQIPIVNEIVDHEVNHYLNWLRGIAVENIVATLRAKSETIRVNELQRLAGLLKQDDIDESSWQVIEKFSKSLVNKLFHDPTLQLRRLQGSRSATDYSDAVRELFCLEIDGLDENETSDVSIVNKLTDTSPSSSIEINSEANG